MRNIGIDFGTCNIKGAEKKKNGKIASIKLGKDIDKHWIPNVILYEKKAEGYKCLLGDAALAKPVAEQDKIRNIKSFLQENGWRRELSFGKVVSAYDVTEDIMKNLYDDIHGINKEQDITATITTPVNFSKRQQLMIKKAAENAGFFVDSVITEPFASFFYLMQDYLDEKEEHNVLVFDFGGGTLDTCLVSTRNSKKGYVVETESTVGISYGGNHISEDILKKILYRKEPEQVQTALEKQENVLRNITNKYFLMQAIDEIKAELFEEGDCDLDGSTEVLAHMFDGTLINFGEVSVSEIYDMLDQDLWDKKIETLLNKLFEDSASLIPNEITDVFLVGGTTSIPYFREKIEQFFKKNGNQDVDLLFEINDEMDADDRIYKSVASGAAIYQELCKDDEFVIKNKIPFVIYTKDESGKIMTKITANDCYKEYSSVFAPLSGDRKASGRISVYQSIYGEKDKEVYLGDVIIDDDYIKEVATLYRLSIDKDRNVFMEFGLLPPDDRNDSEDEVWVEEKIALKIEL